MGERADNDDGAGVILGEDAAAAEGAAGAHGERVERGVVKRRAAVIPTRGVDEAAEEERALLPPVGKVLADLFENAFQSSG